MPTAIRRIFKMVYNNTIIGCTRLHARARAGCATDELRNV